MADERRSEAPIALGCPVCRTGTVAVAVDTAGTPIEGVLRCSQPVCGALFPVLDGIPVLVPDLAEVVTHQAINFIHRDDLPTAAEQVVSDAAGPGSALDSRRLNLSTYAWSHWGHLDPAGDGPKEASILDVLDRALGAADATDWSPSVAALDIGCSTGGLSAALAGAVTGRVVGVDLNFSMLQVAHRAIHGGEVRYPLRRLGLVYETRSFPVEVAGADRVTLVCGDAAMLPVPPGCFGLVTSFNVIDCLTNPLHHLHGIHDALAPNGLAFLATPFDWSPTATQPANWIGGRAALLPGGGDGADLLRSLLDGTHPDAVPGLEVVAEIDGLPWDIRLHDRSTTRYTTDLFVIRRTD